MNGRTWSCLWPISTSPILSIPLQSVFGPSPNLTTGSHSPGAKPTLSSPSSSSWTHAQHVAEPITPSLKHLLPLDLEHPSLLLLLPHWLVLIIPSPFICPVSKYWSEFIKALSNSLYRISVIHQFKDTWRKSLILCELGILGNTFLNRGASQQLHLKIPVLGGLCSLKSAGKRQLPCSHYSAT